jgi:hypothetical protein
MTSQYLTITPNVVNVNEYVAFSQTFTIAFAPPDGLDPVPDPYDYILYDVIIDQTIPEISYNTIVYTRLTDMSFSISGTFSDVFDRSIKYVMLDGTKGDARRFSEVPDDYAGIYQYTPAVINQMPFTMKVRMRPLSVYVNQVVDSDLDVYDLPFIVINNWQVANQNFIQTVQNGGLAKLAISKGLL